MTKLKKTILRVGTHHSPDGALVVTPDRLRHWAAQFERLNQNGQIAPCSWDHADDSAGLLPVSLATYESDRATGSNLGKLHSFRVRPDGNSAEIVIELHDQQAIRSGKTNVVKISPVITAEWTDDGGQTYEDVITHVDFVNHPVDHKQTPFVACALRMNLDRQRSQVYRPSAESQARADAIADAVFGNNPKGAKRMTNLALSQPADGSLVDVSELGDDARAALRQIREIVDRLDGGSLDATLSPNGEGRSPSVQKLDEAIELLYGRDGLIEILGTGDDGDEDGDELRDLAKGAEGLETTTPEFGTMSLDTRVARLFSDGRCSAQERDQQVQRLSLDSRSVKQFCASRESIPAGTYGDGSYAAHKRANEIADEIFTR